MYSLNALECPTIVYDTDIISKTYNISLGGKTSGLFSYPLGGGGLRKPKRPCSYPGYLNLMDGRFCTEYQKKRTNAPNDLANNYLAGLFWPCIAMVLRGRLLQRLALLAL